MNIKNYEEDVIRFATEITKYLISRGSSKQDAEDTVQDTILKIISLDIFIEPDKLRAWMYRVSIRSYINKYRRKQHYQRLIEQIGHELQDFSPPDSTVILADYLKKLKKSDENLLHAYYYENRSVKELAELNNHSVSKVKIDLYRARKKLRKILEQEGISEWLLDQ